MYVCGLPKRELRYRKTEQEEQKVRECTLYVCVPSNNRTVWFRKSRGGEMPLGIYTRSICFDSGGEGGKEGGSAIWIGALGPTLLPTHGCNGCVCEHRT